MANVDEMKRRVLREAVKENIAAVRGVRSQPVQPVHPVHRTRLRKSFLIVGLVVLIASLFLFSTLTGYHQEVAKLLSSLMSTEPSSLAANQAAIPEVPFSEPQPLDGAVFPLGLKKIVLDAGYRGWVGIEYEGQRLPEREGIRLTLRLLERVRQELAGDYR